MIQLYVKRIPDDGFSRPRLQNTVTKRIYTDVSCGDTRYQPRKFNIPGDWHTTSKDGEPDSPIKEVQFIEV